MSAAIIFMLFAVVLSLGIVLVCVYLGSLEPKKVYKIEYKENVQIMPLHSSTVITARNPDSAVKRFHRDFGKNFDVKNVKEMGA